MRIVVPVSSSISYSYRAYAYVHALFCQRKLIASNPPDGLVTLFDPSTDPPSEDGRVSVDGTADALPFGDGPGFFPGFPQGTNDFWLNGGNPTTMWEIVACPVADVEGFLENPLSCLFGRNPLTDDVDGTIMDFFATVDGTSFPVIYSIVFVHIVCQHFSLVST